MTKELPTKIRVVIIRGNILARPSAALSLWAISSAPHQHRIAGASLQCERSADAVLQLNDTMRPVCGRVPRFAVLYPVETNFYRLAEADRMA